MLQEIVLSIKAIDVKEKYYMIDDDMISRVFYNLNDDI